MIELNMFEKATRQGLRFVSVAGMLDIEDLWDLPLTHTARANLNDIAKEVHAALKATDDNISFVEPAEKTDETLQLQMAIVKRVIEVKVAERDAAKLESERREKKQKIMEIIEKKKDEKLSGASLEELEQMLNAV